ncbi:cytochrome P450 [Kitasatospora sp. McL0602]|uniref:cytochrome P450 n=1 Tax=Kitasatospora sp. McL0602 TaxID=3439530 RepID=UPI003F8B2E93
MLTKHADISWVARNSQIFSADEPPSPSSQTSPDFCWPSDLAWNTPATDRKLPQLLGAFLTPRTMAALEKSCRALATRSVAQFVQRLDEHGEADIDRHLGARLTLAAVRELVGAPEQGWDDPANCHETSESSTDAEYDRQTEALHQHVAALVRARPTDPPPTAREVDHAVAGLLVPGCRTTRTAISGGVRALLEHPAEVGKLAANPGLVSSAGEEILRWTTDSLQLARGCTQDIEIRGQQIRKGETLVLWLRAGNRDGDVFPDPDRFDIGRFPNPHFAFGGYRGHISPGANLARVQLRATLRALLPVLPTLELLGPTAPGVTAVRRRA